MTVLVIRHADAGARGSVGTDDQRELSAVGWDQARSLPHLVQPYPVTRLLASRYVRCQQTLDPLATSLGLDVDVHPALAEGATRTSITDLLANATSGTVLCSHGDVIPLLLDIIALAGTTFLDPLTWEKASTWVLDGELGVFATAGYLPPPR